MNAILDKRFVGRVYTIEDHLLPKPISEVFVNGEIAYEIGAGSLIDYARYITLGRKPASGCYYAHDGNRLMLVGGWMGNDVPVTFR